jgi:hypothetical protein
MPKAVGEAERTGEDIQTRVVRMEAIRSKTREVDRIKARLAREKQFNKRVAINAELRAARQELERLSGGAPVTAAQASPAEVGAGSASGFAANKSSNE